MLGGPMVPKLLSKLKPRPRDAEPEPFPSLAAGHEKRTPKAFSSSPSSCGKADSVSENAALAQL